MGAYEFDSAPKKAFAAELPEEAARIEFLPLKEGAKPMEEPHAPPVG